MDPSLDFIDIDSGRAVWFDIRALDDAVAIVVSLEPHDRFEVVLSVNDAAQVAHALRSAVRTVGEPNDL